MALRLSSDVALAFLSFLLCLWLGSGVNFGGEKSIMSQDKTWCIVKPTVTDEQALQKNIDYACSRQDCSVLKKGGRCFNPDTKLSHASVAMNLYYQSKGRPDVACWFNSTGVITISDPSWGACKF